MKIENLTTIGAEPVDGDQIKIIHDNGMTETKYFWTPVDSESSEQTINSILTPLEFLNLFTPQEAKLIIKLSKSNEDVELWWVKYNKATFIDLGDPQTIAGVQSLEASGIIATNRASEILNL